MESQSRALIRKGTVWGDNGRRMSSDHLEIEFPRYVVVMLPSLYFGIYPENVHWSYIVGHPLKSVNCYPGGRKIDLISLISEIQPQT